MLRLKIRSHTQKRYAVLRTTEYTFRKDVYLYWNFGLLIYPPKKQRPSSVLLELFTRPKDPFPTWNTPIFVFKTHLLNNHSNFNVQNFTFFGTFKLFFNKTCIFLS